MNNKEIPKFAASRLVESGVSGDGTSFTEVEIIGNDERAIHDLAGAIGEALGATSHKEIGRSGGSFFGFSSKYWNSPWEPEGPKRNWGPPSDPSLN